MYGYLKKLEEKMSDEQKDMLRRIYAPTVVAVPPMCARRDLCVLADGELRSYGRRYYKEPLMEYISSKDGGISWTRHYARGIMHSCVYFEKAGLYITVVDAHSNLTGEKGLFVYRSEIGPDDEDPEIIKISDKNFVESFQPQQSAFSNRIFFTAQHQRGPHISRVKRAAFFYSDDFGKTWTERLLPSVEGFEVNYPHKDVRWSIGSGAEPHATELSENKMMMLIRSPHDSFYVSYSYDQGDTWTDPEPSTFYGTNTTAFLLRLSDGRVVSFWNNTKPLPELDHKKAFPPVNERVLAGASEDVFTNRDVAHAAITENAGESFIGYREILLNEVRNNTDFRYVGGTMPVADKSVHQFQAIELPFGKILVHLGQGICAQRLLIFDVKWLYEKHHRETFLHGLGNITTHTYVKSILGSTHSSIGNGHCAYNRAPAAYLMPDPEGGYGEALYISNRRDDRLLSSIGGAVWNFPNSKKGKVSFDIKIVEDSARITLSDRWYNTCDEYAAVLSPFSLELSTEEVGTDFVYIEIAYDVNSQKATVFASNKEIRSIEMKNICPTGISYLILQCVTETDSKGFYVRNLQKTEE